MNCPDFNAGECNRLKLTVSPGTCAACKNGQNFERLFSRAGLVEHRPAPLSPGTVFSRAITSITGVLPCHACRERIKQMNQWGWLRCWKNRKQIAFWLAKEASARNHPIDPNAAEGIYVELFKVAVRELRAQRRAQEKTQ